MTILDTPRQNYLLNALPPAEYERLFPLLERVQMSLGKVLYESGEKLVHSYFPTSCIVSKLYVMENGASAEIAMIGNEGFIGVSLIMGGGTMPNRAVVQARATLIGCGRMHLDSNSTALGDVAAGCSTI